MFGWMVKRTTVYKCSAMATVDEPDFQPDKNSEKVSDVGTGPDSNLGGANVHMYSSTSLPGISGMGQGVVTKMSEILVKGEKSGMD